MQTAASIESEATPKPTMASSQPFPFLALPKELRLMVYERMAIQVEHHHFFDSAGAPDFTMIDRYPSAAILRTCRQVYDEAAIIIGRTLPKLTPRIIVNVERLHRLTEKWQPIWYILRYIAAVKSAEKSGMRVNLPFDITDFIRSNDKHFRCPARDDMSDREYQEYQHRERLVQNWFRTFEPFVRERHWSAGPESSFALDIGITASTEHNLMHIEAAVLTFWDEVTFHPFGAFSQRLRLVRSEFPGAVIDLAQARLVDLGFRYEEKDVSYMWMGDILEKLEYEEEWAATEQG